MVRGLNQLERLVAASFAEGDGFLQHCAWVDNWQELFDRAFEQGVAGVLYDRIDTLGFAVPAAVLERVERQFAIDRLWHRRTATDLQRILGAFAQHDVRAVVLKGLVLGERVYPRAMLRPAGDLDLLIAATDLSRATLALGTVGYAPRVWQPHETPPAHATVLEHSGGGTVDLHHLASGGFGTTIEAGQLIDRSLSYRTEGGGETWVLAPEDEVFYLAVHAARHRFTRLGWLVDLGLLIERHPDLDWNVIGARARAGHVRRAATVTWAVLEKRLRFSLPDAAPTALGLDLRAGTALLLAPLATDRARFYSSATGPWAKAYRVFCSHTYRTLLGEGVVASLGYWWRSITRSAGKIF